MNGLNLKTIIKLKTRTVIFLLLLVVSLSYLKSFSNAFVGDDASIFIGNDYFYDLKHIGRLFSKDFVLQFENLDFAASNKAPIFSGFVSYRPVVALTFFSDCFFWGPNSFGAHLTNIFLHFLVSVLVFFFALEMVGRPGVALWAALFFAAHPIHAELVNSISYRSDLLATLFSLCSLLCYRRAWHKPAKNARWLTGSCFSFFLALLSKESAIILPLVFILHDLCFPRPALKSEGCKFIPYFVFAGIAIFYLVLYLGVFPNGNSSILYRWHYDFLTQLRLMGRILSHDLVSLAVPTQVHVLPPLYAPDSSGIPGAEVLIVSMFLFVSIVGGIFQYLRHNRIYTFLAGWFWLTYLPVSNIVLLPNPLAYRFIYLPSIAFFIALALGVEKFSAELKKKAELARLPMILKAGILLLLMASTFTLNFFFKDTYSSCREMIFHYPEARKPYLELGLIHLQHGHLDEAAVNLGTYLNLPSRNPFVDAMGQDYYVHHQLGRCYVNDLEHAMHHFMTAIKLRPDYIPAYLDLADVYLLRNDPHSAQLVAQQVIDLDPHNVLAYIYAIHSDLELGHTLAAQDLMTKAIPLAPDDENLKLLKKELESKLQP